MLISLWLENRIPTEISASSGLNDRPGGFANEKFWFFEIGTHEGDDAHGIGGFVGERLDHLCQTFGSYIFEEPFNVWSWESLVGIKAKRSIFDQDRFVGLSECLKGFFLSNFLWLSLEFRN